MQEVTAYTDVHVFDVIIEPVIMSPGAIHLPWQKVGFEKFFD